MLFYEISNKKGPRAIEVKKLRGAAQNKKKVDLSCGDNLNVPRKFVFKGVRPDVSHRRAAPPVFLPNFDVPAEISNAIRSGDDILGTGLIFTFIRIFCMINIFK